MKKKQETKELKGDISRLTQREKIANESANYWQAQYKGLESLESGFVKIGVKEYDMLINAASSKIQPNQATFYLTFSNKKKTKNAINSRRTKSRND